VRRLAVLVLALAALVAAVPPATAGGGGGSFGLVDFGGSVAGGHSAFASLEVTGSVTVDFHGDTSAGCAAAHLCDTAGTVRWDPSGAATLFAFAYREHGKRFEQGYLTLGEDEPGTGPPRTTAHVRRTGAPGSLCADGASSFAAEVQTPERRGSSLALRIIDVGRSPNGDVLRTHCAGPMAADVAELLPARIISERQLLRRGRTLDFSTDRSFSAHGLAGTVRSTVRMKLMGGDRVPNTDSSNPPRGTRQIRRRTVEVGYRVERVSGTILASVHGLPDPDQCGPLDACGLSGSLTISHSASSGTAFLYANASARHSRGDLLHALGLVRGRRSSGIDRGGSVYWGRDRGTVSSELSRDGTPACADSGPLPQGAGSLELSYSGSRVTAAYLVDPYGGSELLRIRCPGPGSADTAGPIASSASFPRSVFRHRRVTLRLRRGTRFTGVGYGGRTSPDVTIVLRRTRIHSYTFSDELPSDYPGATVRPIH
jgi:hypothetical protein